jgi:hypothetical protein
VLPSSLCCGTAVPLQPRARRQWRTAVLMCCPTHGAAVPQYTAAKRAVPLLTRAGRPCRCIAFAFDIAAAATGIGNRDYTISLRPLHSVRLLRTPAAAPAAAEPAAEPRPRGALLQLLPGQFLSPPSTGSALILEAFFEASPLISRRESACVLLFDRRR